ncbi:RNA-binding protein S4 [Meridianimarinicoccus roseus]|uniref:RNA-binding protein S4 n=1 Tax=Meridianimarinicoccus roseus TaxID=2072018 RepID=A0A2V2LEW5_9RHOB|nr:RNA-binding protein S4 [Meridianimarinicoccus roseus]
MRLDKWLWQARFFKTRGRAAEVVGGGHVRVNARPVSKPSQAVRVGDTLTFAQGRAIRVVRVVGIPVRRGPATEAQALYDDLSPPPPPAAAETGAPTPVVGRVDRKERRAARLSKRGPLE